LFGFYGLGLNSKPKPFSAAPSLESAACDRIFEKCFGFGVEARPLPAVHVSMYAHVHTFACYYSRNHRRKRAEALLSSFSQRRPGVVGAAATVGGAAGGGGAGGAGGVEGVAEREDGDGEKEGTCERGAKMMQEKPSLQNESKPVVGGGAEGSAANVRGFRGGGERADQRAQRRKELLHKEYHLLSFLRPGVG